MTFSLAWEFFRLEFRINNSNHIKLHQKRRKLKDQKLIKMKMINETLLFILLVSYFNAWEIWYLINKPEVPSIIRIKKPHTLFQINLNFHCLVVVLLDFHNNKKKENFHLLLFAFPI